MNELKLMLRGLDAVYAALDRPPRQDVAPSCPDCGSENLRYEEYDYGRCPETGYHDAGVVAVCPSGHRNDRDDCIPRRRDAGSVR